MKKLTEKEFFEDALAILTLPTEPVYILILGREGVMDAPDFFNKFVGKFLPEFHGMLKATDRHEWYDIGDNIHVRLSMFGNGSIGSREWDYQILLGSPEINIYTGKDRAFQRIARYELTRPIHKLL